MAEVDETPKLDSLEIFDSNEEVEKTKKTKEVEKPKRRKKKAPEKEPETELQKWIKKVTNKNYKNRKV